MLRKRADSKVPALVVLDHVHRRLHAPTSCFCQNWRDVRTHLDSSVVHRGREGRAQGAPDQDTHIKELVVGHGQLGEQRALGDERECWGRAGVSRGACGPGLDERVQKEEKKDKARGRVEIGVAEIEGGDELVHAWVEKNICRAVYCVNILFWVAVEVD